MSQEDINNYIRNCVFLFSNDSVTENKLLFFHKNCGKYIKKLFNMELSETLLAKAYIYMYLHSEVISNIEKENNCVKVFLNNNVEKVFSDSYIELK